MLNFLKGIWFRFKSINTDVNIFLIYLKQISVLYKYRNVFLIIRIFILPLVIVGLLSYYGKIDSFISILQDVNNSGGVTSFSNIVTFGGILLAILILMFGIVTDAVNVLQNPTERNIVYLKSIKINIMANILTIIIMSIFILFLSCFTVYINKYSLFITLVFFINMIMNFIIIINDIHYLMNIKK